MAVMNPNWPAEFETGLIPTDNAMGIMTEELSPAAEAFVSMAATAGRPLLDIGAAYGNATLPALEAGSTVIANDLSETQLAILVKSAPAAHLPRLIPVPARFPDALPLAAGSLDGILCAQMLHFLDGPTVERAFAAMHRWLAAGRSIYVVVITPNLGYFRPSRDIYEERTRNGDPWPGIFDPKPFHPPRWWPQLPDLIHLFEKDPLRKLAEGAGFRVDSLEYFCYRKFPDHLRTNGQEYLWMVATKPE